MDELLEKLPYWSSLNDTEKRTVRNSAIIKHYKNGNTLHGNCNDGINCLGTLFHKPCMSEIRGLEKVCQRKPQSL